VLPLDIRGAPTAEEALERLIEAEVLAGENAYTTDSGEKVDALKRCCLKTLPHTLILQFKRFEFNYDTMVKLKLHDLCTFPEVLDMAPCARDEHSQMISPRSQLTSYLGEGGVSYPMGRPPS
jgi:uncharacterized UBP type Zn finger protein